jgi:hypothetical protein
LFRQRYGSLKFRGRSTLQLPKHQWSVKLYGALTADAIQAAKANYTMPDAKTKLALLGFPKSDEFVFNAPWFAEAYAENHVGYTLARGTGRCNGRLHTTVQRCAAHVCGGGGRWATHSRYFEAFLVKSFDTATAVGVGIHTRTRVRAHTLRARARTHTPRARAGGHGPLLGALPAVGEDRRRRQVRCFVLRQINAARIALERLRGIT